MAEWRAHCDECGWKSPDTKPGKNSAEVDLMGHQRKEHPLRGHVEQEA